MERPNARGETPHQPSFLGPHEPPFRRLRVIVSQEMEDAVDREMSDLPVERTAGRPGLAPRGLDRQVDLSQEHAGRGIGGRLGRREREGENVGRLVGVAVVAVQGAQEGVVRKDDGQRGARPVEKAKRLDGQGSKSCRS